MDEAAGPCEVCAEYRDWTMFGRIQIIRYNSCLKGQIGERGALGTVLFTSLNY
jgi:hypothetical protein